MPNQNRKHVNPLNDKRLDNGIWKYNGTIFMSIWAYRCANELPKVTYSENESKSFNKNDSILRKVTLIF